MHEWLVTIETEQHPGVQDAFERFDELMSAAATGFEYPTGSSHEGALSVTFIVAADDPEHALATVSRPLAEALREALGDLPTPSLTTVELIIDHELVPA